VTNTPGGSRCRAPSATSRRRRAGRPREDALRGVRLPAQPGPTDRLLRALRSRESREAPTPTSGTGRQGRGPTGGVLELGAARRPRGWPQSQRSTGMAGGPSTSPSFAAQVMQRVNVREKFGQCFNAQRYRSRSPWWFADVSVPTRTPLAGGRGKTRGKDPALRRRPRGRQAAVSTGPTVPTSGPVHMGSSARGLVEPPAIDPARASAAASSACRLGVLGLRVGP
jgi:hypothetical protein